MINSSSHQNQLYAHEWMAIAFLIGVLVILTLASHSCQSHSIPEVKNPSHHLINEHIEVFIEGAVEFPGKHLIKRGSTIKELFEIAKPKLEADLRRIKLESVLKNRQKFKISVREMVKVVLKFNEDLSQEIIVPKGTKLEDISLLYPFEDHIDLQKLQKKRRLKNGEVIKIPSKKSIKTTESKISVVKKSPLLVISYFKHKKICF